MIPTLIETDLYRCLTIAAYKAIVRVPDRPASQCTVSTTAFVRNFKKLWLFAESATAEPNAVNGPLYFLFWKNTSVTNVSFNELISLIRTYTQYAGPDKDERLPGLINFQFTTDSEYSNFIFNMWASFFDNVEDTKASVIKKLRGVCKHMATHYALILAHTIVFNHYYTSALLTVPRSLTVRLIELVANSGYVHSAGRCLYVRNIEKATKPELISQIDTFLRLNPGKKYYLVPYAEEFFAPWEKQHSASSLRNGLDGVRFHFRKHTVGKNTLQEILSLLPAATDNRILVASGLKDYWTERKESISSGADVDTTIWLLTDHNVHETDMPGYFSKGTKQYFFMYAQIILNENQLTLFKERKPAWTAPITLPHTLSTALTNIAHERWALEVRSNALLREPRRPVIVDPFCGTGTTLIDAKRIFENAIVIGLDRNPLAYSLCVDNLSFFSEPPEKLDTFLMNYAHAPYREEPLIEDIRSCAAGEERANLEAPLDGSPQSVLACLTKALLHELFIEHEPPQASPKYQYLPLLRSPFFAERIQRVLDDGFSAKYRAYLTDILTSEQRRLSYLIWRGFVYGRYSVNSLNDLYFIITSELNMFVKESQQYHAILKAKEIARFGSHAIKRTEYSSGASISIDAFRKLLNNTHAADLMGLSQKLEPQAVNSGIYVCHVDDSANALQHLKGKVDILITDPPYGFNTAEHDVSLRDLYGGLFLRAVQALRPGGQLIVALPDYARNGRQIPFYQTKTAVVQQVLSHAQSDGRRILKYGDSIPAGQPLFGPPYYWASTTGVSRSILHFIVN